MTITLTREEVQHLLDAWDGYDQQDLLDRAIENIRARLAQPEPPQRTGDCLLTGVCAAEGHRIQKEQPEPKPHGYLWFTRYMEQRFTHRKPEEVERIGDVKPVFAAPPQREWQSLTDEELISCLGRLTFKESLRAVEEKLREKNNG